MEKHYSIIAILLSLCLFVYPQKVKTDANIVGHVTFKGVHIPYASIIIKGTTIGTVGDATGHYQFINLPLGELVIQVNVVGYKPAEASVFTHEGVTTEIKFELEEDVLRLDEVVVSADRSEQKRNKAPIIVSTISPKLFNITQSVTLGEGLNFSPGLRLENNCQNCGFTQVRMNGMEGPYTQILINSRPVFSGLAGVYGLELIPSNMIEKVEVVRGGGSALYGSNAIAGTINIILKDPAMNTYEAGTSYSLSGIGMKVSDKAAPDFSLNFNTSMVSDDQKSGIALYGFNRKREIFDANNDGFSEIAPMNNITLGTRLFHRFGYRSKLSVDYFAIREERDGGNRHEFPLHERDVAEAVKHNMNNAALTYEQYFRKYDLLSIYSSAQFLDRNSYYGANKSLSDYGASRDRTYNTGIQYKAAFNGSSVIAGIENTGGLLKDQKLGYPDFSAAIIENDSIKSIPHIGNTVIANQFSITTGVFIQYEIKLNHTKVALGGRFDHYQINDLAKEGNEEKSGDVFSPRISIMQEISDQLQARIGYSKGFRAPQIFDEDLHIETSGSRQVINVNDPGLKQENSNSFNASLDFNGLIGTVYTGFLVDGFFTRLYDPFVNEIGEPDEEGTVIYTRVNAADGATVSGINMEFKLNPLRIMTLTSGFTLQRSRYDAEQEFNEKRFFRTPDQYGYMALDFNFENRMGLSATTNYTGKMLVPYFGPDADPNLGELRQSEEFLDLGLKIKQTVKLNGSNIQWFLGMKNIFNSYQNDFDKGIDRDPAYMYGPVSPRTLYFGIKFGNFLD